MSKRFTTSAKPRKATEYERIARELKRGLAKAEQSGVFVANYPPKFIENPNVDMSEFMASLTAAYADEET